MGKRGPDKQYDVSMRLTVTHSQNEFLEAMSNLQDVSKQEVVRRMIDSFFPYSLAQYGYEMNEKG
jgi:hypothetical protein